VYFLVVSATAYAEPTTEQRDRARQLYESACTHYRLYELEAAAQDFKASFQIVPRPFLLFNLAQTYRQLHRNADAVFFYRQYLAVGQLSAAERRTVTDRIEELQSLIERQRVAEAAPPVGPDPAPSAPAATAAPPAAPPPVPSPVPPVQLQPIVISPSLTVAATKPLPPHLSAAGWTLLGVGLAVSGIGAGLLGYAPTLQTEARNAMTVAEQERDTKAYNDVQLSGYVILGVGAALTLSSVAAFGVAAHRYNRSGR
jgi:tetratricopeptide (TPR) repeat protein